MLWFDEKSISSVLQPIDDVYFFSGSDLNFHFHLLDRAPLLTIHSCCREPLLVQNSSKQNFRQKISLGPCFFSWNCNNKMLWTLRHLVVVIFIVLTACNTRVVLGQPLNAETTKKFAPAYCLRFKFNCNNEAKKGHVCCIYPLPENGQVTDNGHKSPLGNKYLRFSSSCRKISIS